MAGPDDSPKIDGAIPLPGASQTKMARKTGLFGGLV